MHAHDAYINMCRPSPNHVYSGDSCMSEIYCFYRRVVKRELEGTCMCTCANVHIMCISMMDVRRSYTTFVDTPVVLGSTSSLEFSVSLTAQDDIARAYPFNKFISSVDPSQHYNNR